MLVLKGLVGLHRTAHFQLLQHYWLGHRLGLLRYWMVCLGNEQRYFVIFEIASRYCISDSFVDHDGSSISSKGFLPTVVDMSSELNSPIPVRFSSLIPRMSMSTLPSPVWPLPICLDSWTWHSRFLCNTALYNIGPCFCCQSHPQLGIVFALAPSLHSFWSYFSTDLQ